MNTFEIRDVIGVVQAIVASGDAKLINFAFSESKMRFFVFEYETFFIGIATRTVFSSVCVEYAMEIHALFLGTSKPFYVYFSNGIVVLTNKDTSKWEIEMEVAGEFSRTPVPLKVPPTYNRFKFDPDNRESSIKAQLNKKTGQKTKEDIERILKNLDTLKCIVGFNVYKTEI